MNYLQQTFFFYVLLSLISALNPETKVTPKQHEKSKSKSYSTSDIDTKSPYELEQDALKAALYCNADKMESGDSCYCGRVILSCCSSKDKCTGSFTRSCSDKVDDFTCDRQVTQGLAYWQETQNLEEHIECSNDHYAENKPCVCGKIMESCCQSKTKCDVGFFSETCDKKVDDSSCEAEMQEDRIQVKPKYYTKYSTLFSFGAQGIVNNLSLICLTLIYLLKF